MVQLSIKITKLLIVKKGNNATNLQNCCFSAKCRSIHVGFFLFSGKKKSFINMKLHLKTGKVRIFSCTLTSLQLPSSLKSFHEE